MQRINWIDWVKAWCMTVVVFDHTPHDGSPFLLQFLAGTNLASFFFISGYLKKPSTSQKESLKKYANCLLIPYLIYNAIFYPYWIGKTYIEQGGMPSFSECLKPIIGTFLGQLDSNFSCQLNGVTWFLISLFIMHWITDICNRQKNGKAWMLGISIIAMFLYGLNKYAHFAPYLPFHGLVRCIPFFFLGSFFSIGISMRVIQSFTSLSTSLFVSSPSSTSSTCGAALTDSNPKSSSISPSAPWPSSVSTECSWASSTTSLRKCFTSQTSAIPYQKPSS